MPGSSSIGGTPPTPQQPDNTKPEKVIYNPGDVNASQYPDPFPGMHMTDEEKKKFWNNMVSQMNSTIQSNTKKMKEALDKLKESENGDS